MDSADPARPAVTSYSRGAQLLHWTIALLIVLNFTAALVAHEVPKPEAKQIMGNHKAIGLTILILTLVRIAWRLTHKPPPFAPTLKPWEKALANVVHGLFYALMLAIPVSGWLTHSAFSGGQSVSWFGLFDLPGLPLARDAVLGESYGGLHGTMAWLMLGLFVVHVLGALKHHFVTRDGELWRMIPR